LASLTNETPTFACTTRFELVLKVTKMPSGAPPMIFDEVNGWSNIMSKCRV
jgi:hypothetical protein